jgi:hypothetical protein
VQAFQAMAKKKGVVPAPLLAKPKLQPQDTAYLRAYQILDEGRGAGMVGPNPISIADIEAYCNLTGIASQRERLKYLRLVRRLDQVYLGHWAEKNNNRPPG